jgi:hypothetical protein
MEFVINDIFTCHFEPRPVTIADLVRFVGEKFRLDIPANTGGPESPVA